MKDGDHNPKGRAKETKAIEQLLRAVEKHRLAFLYLAVPKRLNPAQRTDPWETVPRDELPGNRIPIDDIDAEGEFLFRHRGSLDFYAQTVVSRFGTGRGAKPKAFSSGDKLVDVKGGSHPGWWLDEAGCQQMEDCSDELLDACRRLSEADQFGHWTKLVDQVTSVVNDGDHPRWYTSNVVRWEYLQRLDEAIRALKLARLGRSRGGPAEQPVRKALGAAQSEGGGPFPGFEAVRYGGTFDPPDAGVYANLSAEDIARITGVWDSAHLEILGAVDKGDGKLVGHLVKTMYFVELSRLIRPALEQRSIPSEGMYRLTGALLTFATGATNAGDVHKHSAEADGALERLRAKLVSEVKEPTSEGEATGGRGACDVPVYYLAVRKERTFGPENALGEPYLEPKTEATFFYRVSAPDAAGRLVGAFQARFKDHETVEEGRDDEDGDELIVTTKFFFEAVPSDQIDEGERLVIDERIDRLASEVSRYCGQWQYEAMEMQSDGIFQYDPYDPPLYDEENPLSPGSLHHQAEKWETKLRPPSDIPPADLEKTLSWEGADPALSVAKNWERMKKAEAERAEKLMGLASRAGLEKLSPFDVALIGLLESLLATWARMDFSEFSHAQEKALARLTEAGLVENRIDATATMESRSETIRVRCRVAGDYKRTLCQELLSAMPGWLDDDGKITGRVSFRYDVVEARLTDEGELAKQDWQSPEPSFVLMLVRGAGPHGAGAIKAQGAVRIEERHIDRPADPVAGPAAATAAADESKGASNVSAGWALAYESYQWLAREHPELLPDSNSRTRYTLDMYRKVKEECPACGKEGPPPFETWKRYIRGFERASGGRKNSPRGGRPHGSSIVRPDQI